MFNFEGMTDEKKAQFIMANHQHMKQKRQRREPLWDLIIKLFRPRRFDMLRQGLEGQQFGQKIYTGRPENCAQTFATGFWNYMASSAKLVPWLGFSTDKQDIILHDDVKIYFQKCSEQISFSFSKSTFYDEAPMAVEDGVSIGTGILLPDIDLVNGRVAYQCIHPGEGYLENDRYGNLAVYHREFKMTAINAYDEFGDESPEALIKDAVGSAGGDPKPFTEWDFIYAIYRNVNHRPNSIRSQDQKYIEFYVAMNKDPNKSQIVQEKGKPYFVVPWRMKKETGQAYGTSISAMALTEAIYMNKLGQKGMQAVHLAVEPPYQTKETMKGKVNTLPGGGTFYGTQDEQVSTWLANLNWPISDAEMKDIRDSLEEKFSIRLFKMLNRDDLPQMTAYQVAQMKAELAILLPGVGSCETEFLASAVEVQWDFETKAGRMPDAPDRLLNETDGEVQPVFLGPLSIMRRQMLQGRGIIEGLAVAREVASMWPNALIKVKEMDTMEETLISQGFKPTLLRSDDEVDKILEAQAQMAQQDRQLEVAERTSKIVPQISKNIEPQSPAGLMLGTVAQK